MTAMKRAIASVSVVAAILLVFLSLAKGASTNGRAEAAYEEEEQLLLKRVERTIGGTGISRGQWPWLVLLKATLVKTRFLGIPLSHSHLYCGGAVLDSRWIITAAHCFTENGHQATQPGSWEARLATTSLKASFGQRILDLFGRIFREQRWRQWEIDVQKIIVHPSYNISSLWADDIALVKLKEAVPSGPQFSLIRSVKLPPSNDPSFPSVGQVCVTKGWGCTSAGGPPSRDAQMIRLPVQATSTCSSSYRMPMAHRLCAGFTDGGVGVCPGDSGSPLVCERNGEHVLAGLVSFNSGDEPADYPAVFTRVADYLPWIRQVMATQ